MTETLAVVDAAADDAAALAEVAAVTFPLACPPSVTEADVADFLATVLSADRFADYLTAPDRAVLKAVGADGIVGYAMLVDGVVDDPDVRAAVTAVPTVEISKLYVLPDHHGEGVSHLLMSVALERARARGAAGVWLGVNQENVRAQRFYAKQGFERVGTKRFRVGDQLHHDFVLERRF
ncbi:GNAT family N-acetyltransferase [Rhodococcus spelaei]|uniref:GNAT family N-acetyltransferase n=1 Tax=Rhodococcus spelaei TaxID=2546320 RepID=A0A541B1Z4_9NOCA|nr:GNAT family N-acetyltransferase [Rhodococcus spelaei]TQF66325.1 GNAT family N-acetyltransferase [Rhodococcus spelaei]